MRSYAKVYVSIWGDEEFKALSLQAQALYFRLLTDPKLSMCGVCDWRPNRLAMSSHGSTAKTVRTAGEELEAARFILIDEDSEEVLIRTFVKHDGVLKSPNLTKAMVTDWTAIASGKLQRAVVCEALAAAEREPEMKGIPELPEHFQLVPDPDPEPIWNPSESVPEGLPIGSGKGSGNPSESVPDGLPSPSPILQPATNNQQPATKDMSARRGRFDEFWAIYPKRGRHSNPKEPARQKWNDLVRTVDPDVIFKAVRELAELRRGEDPQHTPQAITWLNQKRFLDDPAEVEKAAPSTPFVTPQPPPDMPRDMYVRWAKAQRDAWLSGEPGPDWRELQLVEAS